MNVVHIFPYSARVSGGHSNAIRSFIACQRAAGTNAVGIAPQDLSNVGQMTCEFPLVEVDSLWELRWTILAERFEIPVSDSLVHLHSMNRRFGPLLADLRRAGVPYVFTSHGQLGFQSLWRWLLKFVYLNCVNRDPFHANGLHLLTQSAGRRVDVLLPGYRGLRLIQGNLVTDSNLSGLASAARSAYEIPPDAFVLLFVGRLDVRVKGLDLLVEAFSRLPSQRFRLVIAGPDWEGGKAKLERLATRFGCGERVQFPGPVYGTRKWALLRMADLFVSPSRWEAFGIGQVEAMTAGLPVVTSAKGSLAPDFQEAAAAMLTPPAVEPLTKAIATLEADPERRRTLALGGQAWARNHCDPGLAGARFHRFYQSILETGLFI